MRFLQVFQITQHWATQHRSAPRLGVVIQYPGHLQPRRAQGGNHHLGMSARTDHQYAAHASGLGSPKNLDMVASPAALMPSRLKTF